MSRKADKGATLFPSRRHAKSFKGSESRTLQSEHAATKLDGILRKYATVGPEAAMLFGQRVQAMPFGVQEVADYQETLNRAVEVQRYFSALPSSTRAFFDNQPSNMLAFLQDEGNRDKAEELGLVVKREADGEDREPAPSPTSPPPAANGKEATK